MLKIIATDWALNIPNPFPALKICRIIVITTPLPAEEKAAVVDVLLQNKPKISGAVNDTDIKE